MRLRSLQNPSHDIVNLLKNIYNTPVSSQSNTSSTSSNIFNSNPSGSSVVFGQKSSFGNQGNSIFAQANQNIFGGTKTNSVFGNQANNVFATNPNQTSGGNVFGQNNANPTMQGSNSIFGGQPANSPVPSGSIFGSSPTNTFSTSGNIFLGKQNSNAFGQSSQSSSIFGSQNTTILQQPNLFNTLPTTQSSSPPPNVFGTSPNTQLQSPPMFGFQNASPQTSENVFGPSPNSQAQPNMFGLQNPLNLQQSSSPNVFGTSPNMPTSIVQPQQQQVPVFQTPSIQTSPQQISTNIFAAATSREVSSPIFPQSISNSPFAKNSSETQSHTTSIFGTRTFNNLAQNQNEPIDREIYSKLEDLTEEEIKWFESEDLNNFNVPDKPPTYEMCFKA